MKNVIFSLTFIVAALTSNAQCDPGLVNHYNVGDFPFTSSTGVTVNMGGTNSGTLGPYNQYGCSPALCDANTIRLDPGDTLIFTFSQPVFDLTFVSGVMNTTENGKIETNNGTPILTSNCPTDLQITGNSFAQFGPLGSPVITVSIPGWATSISIICLPASNNGVFTVDLLDCINELVPPCGTTGSLVANSCDSYTSPSGNYTWTSTGLYSDTIPNAAGCDSVISLDITINTSSVSTDTQVACDSYMWIDGNTYTSSDSASTYTLSNTAGCDSIVTLALTINTVDASAGQVGELLTANEAGATYQWLDCSDMSLISGATNQSYTATANGDYAVIVSANGCTDTSSCLTVSGLSLTEEDFLNDLRLFPNPTNGNFSVDLGANYQDIEFSLRDLSGRLIQTNYFDGGQLFELKLNESAGAYLLQIDSAGKLATIRLVKE
ncbi:MAG: T9SS type A sorting domain-containing protein [Crocinitomicaceae bacterium]|nr:T9SS type A sorting domain-containing protein [Crocinitomicaceae bacterium]